jgi:hypothetical protein
MSEFRQQLPLDAPLDRVRELVGDPSDTPSGVRGCSIAAAITSFRSERVAGVSTSTPVARPKREK